MAQGDAARAERRPLPRQARSGAAPMRRVRSDPVRGAASTTFSNNRKPLPLRFNPEFVRIRGAYAAGGEFFLIVLSKFTVIIYGRREAMGDSMEKSDAWLFTDNLDLQQEQFDPFSAAIRTTR
ncbi:MAG: hypothetical protein ACK4VM_13445, partial [Bosea sp. (in: a-proteobacteria)]